MMSLKNILIPVDFSKEAELAVNWAVKLGKEERAATLILLHVIPPVPMAERGIDIGAVIDAEIANAKKNLAQWRAKVPTPLNAVALVEIGDAVDRIITTCTDKKIDLVVMTTQGRRGLSRVLHPNLTEKVVRGAPCPVLALHLNEEITSHPRSRPRRR